MGKRSRAGTGPRSPSPARPANGRPGSAGTNGAPFALRMRKGKDHKWLTKREETNSCGKT